MKHALAALGMLLAWDILRRRMRAFHTCRPDGTWREFPSYRERCEQREKAAFIEGRNAALCNAAMKAYDMGHPEIRDAINEICPERWEKLTEAIIRL